MINIEISAKVNMASLLSQRELLVNLKRETYLNINLLHTLFPLPVDISRQLFKEDALEKPSQHVFINLSYYLVSIISPKNSNTLPWPLYDSKSERLYKNELANFITRYHNSGLVSPVMSSYYVNPSCFKVKKLIFQLSQLAIKTSLDQRIKKESQKSLLEDISAKYSSLEKNEFNDIAENATKIVSAKISEHQKKKRKMEDIAELMRKQILENETQYNNKKELINKIIDNYIKQTESDNETKALLETIKDLDKPAEIFDEWLLKVDNRIKSIENEWDIKTGALLLTSRHCQEITTALMARYTGEAEKNTYTVEYNPEKEQILTKDLEAVVTSQQRYILKNITREGRLIFPNLIRGFIVAICYIFKNTEVGNEVFAFRKYLERNRRDFAEALSTLKVMISRMLTAESKLKCTSINTSDYSINEKELRDVLFAIPPLPDLTINNDTTRCQIAFDSYTPLNVTRRQFNMLRKRSLPELMKPPPRSVLTTPFHSGPRDDFLKTVISCRVSMCDRSMAGNISIMSQPQMRINETVADCSTGFTKQQIMRLLSTKKKSNTKKQQARGNGERLNVKAREHLFVESNENGGLFRSYSSPNLFENKGKKRVSKVPKLLSTMQEKSPSFLDVSGIVALENNSKDSTPIQPKLLDSPKVLIDKYDVELCVEKPALGEKKGLDKECGPETPKMNMHPIKKTSSIERIINRYNRVRNMAVLNNHKELTEEKECKIIYEEKENNLNCLNAVKIDVFTSNKNLLPDLLSPSCNLLNKISNENSDIPLINISDDFDSKSKPRESLGAALGVDNTFLDQFDLID